MTTKLKRSAAVSIDAEDDEQQRFSEAVHKKQKIEASNDFLQQRIEKERSNSETRGVIYIGHLPHGFYEDELRKYFSQFGEVTRVRVSRSRKTGGSRGYAFVEFLHKDVAQVAADTMNGYLMFEKILKVHLLPQEKVHHDLFAPKFPFPLNREITRTFINMERTETREMKNKQTRLQKFNKKMSALKDLGIKYDLKPIGAEGVTIPERKAKVPNSAGESDSEGENCTLLVDSDDDEIEFKTPPHVNRKSLRGSAAQSIQKKTSTPAAKKTPISTSVGVKKATSTPMKSAKKAKQVQEEKPAIKEQRKAATPAGKGKGKSQESGKKIKRKTIM